MLISSQALGYWIDHFYGFGSWKAPVWFVGLEEASGDSPEEVAEKLNYFQSHVGPDRNLCDIRDLYAAVAFRSEGPRAEKFETLYDYRFGKQAVLHGGWKNLIAFRSGFLGKPLPDLLKCQQTKLASISDPQETLLYFYPLPAHHHAWYYAWLDVPQLPFLKSRALYQRHLLETRLQALYENIQVHKPKVVLMYDMEGIQQLKSYFQSAYPGISFAKTNGIPREYPAYHCADLDGTILIITTHGPTLRHNRIETGFDWYGFGKRIRESVSRK